MAEHNVPPAVVMPIEWQELPEELLEAICGLLAPPEHRSARLVCKHWGRAATSFAVSSAAQPHVLDMLRDPVLWKQQLSAGAKMMPQLTSFQVHVSSRLKEARAEENLAQLYVFSSLTDLKLVHTVGTVYWLEVLNTNTLHRPVLGREWPLPLRALRHLPSLQRLTLQTANVPNPPELQSLSAVSRLSHLVLDQDNVKHGCLVDVHFDALVALPSLRSLELHVRGNAAAALDLSRLVGLEELKVTLFQQEPDEYDVDSYATPRPSYQAGLLAAVLPPLTRLTCLRMGSMVSSSQHFAAALRQYAAALPAQPEGQPAAGAPSRPLLHLDVALVEEDGAAGGGVDEQVLDALAPQLAHLRLSHDPLRGAAPHPSHHPSIAENACVVHQEPLPAIASRLASTPNVAALSIRRPHVTDAELEALVSPCPHLTSLHVLFATTAACPLMADVCQDGDHLTNLRTLALICSNVPARPEPGDEPRHDPNTLWLLLDFLPASLQALTMRGCDLDTGLPGGDPLDPAGGSGAAAIVGGGGGLREITLSHGSLTGLGIAGLLRQCTSLRSLSMTAVEFCGGGAADAAGDDLTFPRSVTSLKINSCRYRDKDVPEELAAHRGYAWVCTLRNLRNLDWTGGLSEFVYDSSDIMRMLPEVLPSLRKLHNVQIAPQWHGYGSEKYVRKMLKDLPFADYVTTVGQEDDDGGFEVAQFSTPNINLEQLIGLEVDGIGMDQFEASMMYLMDLQMARLGYSAAGGYR